MTLTLLSAFLLGLFGGVHCASMCGGIVALLGSRQRIMPLRLQDGAAVANPPSILPLQLAYNAGRIGSYGMAGAVAGAVGSAAWLAGNVLPIQQIAFVAANLVMIALGIALTGLLRGGLGRLRVLERLGAFAWRRIAPIATRGLGATRVSSAFATGAAWGWVPCGMVYGVLVAALVSGGPLEGAMLMLAFGAGTLPNLLALGYAAEKGARLLTQARARAFAGVLIVVFGVAGLARIDPIAHLHAAVDACVQWLQ